MNLTIGSVQMPAAVLNIFNIIIILILIPILDRVLYPILARYGRSPTHLQKIGDTKFHVQVVVTLNFISMVYDPTSDTYVYFLENLNCAYA